MTFGLNDPAFLAAVGAVAAAPEWHDAATEAQCDGQTSGSATQIFWSPLTLPAGSCTKLRFFKYNYNSTNVKLALYNSGGSLLAESPGIAVLLSGTYEVTLSSPVSVSAGTHYIGIVVDASYSTAFGTYTGGSSPTFSLGAASSYTAPSTLPSADYTSTAAILCVGAYV
jgi:hypothetical protein